MIFYGKINDISVEKRKEEVGFGISGEVNYVYVIVEMPHEENEPSVTRKMRIDNFFHGWFSWKRITNKRINIIKKSSEEFIGKYFLFSEKEGEVKSGMFTQELHHAAQISASGL